ncbi:hypothetical protein PG990_005242 [Apiospora arundinis]
MSGLFPSHSILQQSFGSPAPSRLTPRRSQPTPYQARSELYGAFSVVDDAKDKAKKLSADAQAEFDKASAATKAKTGQLELYSGGYYAACTFGGLMACLSHGLTPSFALLGPHTHCRDSLDLVKCRRQVDSKLYKGNFQAWGMIFRQEGLRGIFTGWGPTLLGYSAQGAFKYGWYEYFKKTYADIAGPENAYKYKTGLYLAASASAEFLADIALCPFEAVKITAAEGLGGLYKGLYPLWGRQIPYTMMKFASFETIVEMMYARLPGQKSDYSKAAQTGVSFASGYLAGILCAIVSHPADVLVSKLNANRASGEGFGAAVARNYRDIGFMGLWNGLPVRIVMIGTLTGLQWMIYDYFKIFMGFPSTGGGALQPRRKSKLRGFQDSQIWQGLIDIRRCQCYLITLLK